MSGIYSAQRPDAGFGNNLIGFRDTRENRAKRAGVRGTDEAESFQGKTFEPSMIRFFDDRDNEGDFRGASRWLFLHRQQRGVLHFRIRRPKPLNVLWCPNGRLRINRAEGDKGMVLNNGAGVPQPARKDWG